MTVAADDENNNNDNNSAINSQDALIILRSSFSAPKVLHLLVCSPSVSHNSLAKFDALLRHSVQRITNSDLTDIQWIQGSLPVVSVRQKVVSQSYYKDLITYDAVQQLSQLINLMAESSLGRLQKTAPCRCRLP